MEMIMVLDVNKCWKVWLFICFFTATLKGDGCPSIFYWVLSFSRRNSWKVNSKNLKLFFSQFNNSFYSGISAAFLFKHCCLKFYFMNVYSFISQSVMVRSTKHLKLLRFFFNSFLGKRWSYCQNIDSHLSFNDRVCSASVAQRRMIIIDSI